MIISLPLRVNMEEGGGAWCPKQAIQNEGKEFLEIDLGQVKIKIETLKHLFPHNTK